MPLLQQKLADQIANMALSAVEVESAQNFANAWKTYFMDASVAGVPIAGSIDAAASAMVGAMTGMSLPGAGPLAMTAGLGAFWGVIMTLGPTLWAVPAGPVILVTPPPGLSGVSAAVAAAGTANIAGGLSKEASASAIAAALHGTAGIGGIATVQIGPTPTPTPIL